MAAHAFTTDNGTDVVSTGWTLITVGFDFRNLSIFNLEAADGLDVSFDGTNKHLSVPTDESVTFNNITDSANGPGGALPSVIYLKGKAAHEYILNAWY